MLGLRWNRAVVGAGLAENHWIHVSVDVISVMAFVVWFYDNSRRDVD